MELLPTEILDLICDCSATYVAQHFVRSQLRSCCTALRDGLAPQPSYPVYQKTQPKSLVVYVSNPIDAMDDLVIKLTTQRYKSKLSQNTRNIFRLAHRDNCYLSTTTDYASLRIKSGRSDLLIEMLQARSLLVHELIDYLVTAAKHNQVHCMNILCQLKKNYSQEDFGTAVAVTAAQYGNIECLKIARQYGFPFSSTFWSERNRNCCTAAAEYGNLECLQYAYENDCPTYDSTNCAYRKAAAGGYLDCLTYLFQQWEPSSHEIMDICSDAIASGHSDCFLYAHKILIGLGCSIINAKWQWYAAMFGKLDVLEHLFSIDGMLCPHTAIFASIGTFVLTDSRSSVFCGTCRTSKFANARYRRSCETCGLADARSPVSCETCPDCISADKIKHTYVQSNRSASRLRCLQFVHQHGVELTTQSMSYAVWYRSVECLAYHHQHNIPLDQHITNIAAERGSIECLRYARENGCDWGRYVIYLAISESHLDCLRYAVDNGCEWDDSCVSKEGKAERVKQLGKLLLYPRTCESEILGTLQKPNHVPLPEAEAEYEKYLQILYPNTSLWVCTLRWLRNQFSALIGST